MDSNSIGLFTSILQLFQATSDYIKSNKIKSIVYLIGAISLFVLFSVCVMYINYWVTFNNEKLNRVVGPKAFYLKQIESEATSIIISAGSNVIDVWDELSSQEVKQSEPGSKKRKLINDTRNYINRLMGFGFRDFNDSMYVYYLYHLSYLHMILSDLTGQYDGIFLAEYYLTLADKRIDSNRGDKAFYEYLDNNDQLNDNLWLMMNIKVFQYLRIVNSSGNDDTNKLIWADIHRLKTEIGGCKYLEHNELKHPDIIKVICPNT